MWDALPHPPYPVGLEDRVDRLLGWVKMGTALFRRLFKIIGRLVFARDALERFMVQAKRAIEEAPLSLGGVRAGHAECDEIT